jgi:hypothetical protein
MSSSPGHVLSALLACSSGGSIGCKTDEECGDGAACCDGTCAMLHSDENCTACGDDCTHKGGGNCLFPNHCSQRTQVVSCAGEPSSVTYWACAY